LRAPVAASVRALLVVTLLCGVLYPIVVTAAAQWLAGDRADGSLVRDAEGVVVGSELIAPVFS
jgi:potassium-transporting ATPase KdpC subunit